MQSPVSRETGKKRDRTDDETKVTTATTTPTTVMAIPSSGGGIANRNFNFMASSIAPTPLSTIPAPTTTIATTANTTIGSSTTVSTASARQQQVPKPNNKSNSNHKTKSKEDILSSLGLLPAQNKIRVKSCDPTAGLTLGGKPVSEEQLKNLTPMDLDEHVLMRNGIPLEIDELARLLGMEEDFDEEDFLDETPDDEQLLLGMIETGMLDMFLQNMGDVGALE